MAEKMEKSEGITNKSTYSGSAGNERSWYEYTGYDGSWVEETRGALMVLSTVIITMTFQPTISPPGGLWQANSKEGETCGVNPCLTGKSVLASTSKVNFTGFMFYNTLSFSCSVATIFLLMHGATLRKHFSLVILAFCMSVNLVSLSLEYVAAIYQITPDHVYEEGYNFIVRPIYIIVWVIALALLYHAMRFAYWVGLVLIRKIKTCM